MIPSLRDLDERCPRRRARGRRLTHALRACCASLTLLSIARQAPQAQGLPIKTAVAASSVGGCAAFAPPSIASGSVAPNADAEARRLSDEAQDAALQGDHAAARDAFARAARLTPGNARIAYYLGREHEALRESTDAVREYCRYLALTPAAPDADEVRGRIVRLTPASELARVDEARATFSSGVALLQHRQYVAADSAFAAVARQVPNAPEPFFNRGLARAARGNRTLAMQDFEKYLELAPQSTDRGQLRDAMARLPDRVFAPGSALLSGLLVPGLGQMSTGRPVRGVVALGLVTASLVWGMQLKEWETVELFTDPFGNPYQDTVPRSERSNLPAGLAIAGVIWAGSAVEAATYARRSGARAAAIIARFDGPTVRGSSGRGRDGKSELALLVMRLPRGRTGLGLALSADRAGGVAGR